jgi:hypothetical protein
VRTSDTAPEPVNPLTGDLTTVTISRRGNVREDVQARLVAPGLAITPDVPDEKRPDRPRFSVTHVASGLALRTRMCGEHVQVCAEMAVASPVDWTEADQPTLVAAVKETDLLEKTLPISPCIYGYCTGDGPEPPTYSVRCNTCNWEWEDEHEEGPLSRKEAENQAADHECDPDIEIKSPVTGRWHHEWYLGEAEKKASAEQDATATRPSLSEGGTDRG